MIDRKIIFFFNFFIGILTKKEHLFLKVEIQLEISENNHLLQIRELNPNTQNGIILCKQNDKFIFIYNFLIYVLIF